MFVCVALLTFRNRATSRGVPILLFGNRSDAHGSVDIDKEGHMTISPAANHTSGAPSLAVLQAEHSLGEQDKPDDTHIHGRANEKDVYIYGTALITSESPGVE